MCVTTRRGSKLDKVAREHRRRESSIEVTRRTQLKVLRLQRVVANLGTVRATGIALVRDCGNGLYAVCERGRFVLVDWARGFGRRLVDV